MERAAHAGERDGDANERRDAGAVDLRDAVEVNDDLAAGLVEDGLKRRGQLVARFANGEPAVHVKNVDTVLVAHVDFDGSVLGHGESRGQGLYAKSPSKVVQKPLKAWKPSAATRHYTIVGPGFVKRLSPLGFLPWASPGTRLQG